MNQLSAGAGYTVPVDSELAVSLQHRPELVHPTPVTLETLPHLRRAGSGNVPDDEALTRGGRYRVDEETVPAGQHLPAVNIVLCRPRGAANQLRVKTSRHGSQHAH